MRLLRLLLCVSMRIAALQCARQLRRQTKRVLNTRGARVLSTSAADDANRPYPITSTVPGLFQELLSVAPMMDYTDRHFRALFRLLSRRICLYTEMVAANTLVDSNGIQRYADLDRFLLHSDGVVGGTVLQLGGADAKMLGHAAKVALPYNYAGINLNCGCPSDRVAGAGCFGAAMMRQPKLVAECCAEMAASSGLPVTVKCRVGVVQKSKDLAKVDPEQEYAALYDFVDTISREAPVERFILHARVAARYRRLARRKTPPVMGAEAGRSATRPSNLKDCLRGRWGLVNKIPGPCGTSSQ